MIAVRGEPRGNIDGNHLRASRARAIDRPDRLRVKPRGRARQPRPEQRVNNQLRVSLRHALREAQSRVGAGKPPEDLKVGPGFACSLADLAAQVDRDPCAPHPEQAGDNRAVPAVVSFAAEDRASLARGRAIMLGNRLDDARAGRLHQGQKGDAGALDRQPVKRAHLFGGEDLHRVNSRRINADATE
jgi:hypothetical protein